MAISAPRDSDRHVLSRYALLTAPLLALNLSRLVADVPPADTLAGFWMVAAFTVYTAFALLVVFLPLLLLDAILRWRRASAALGKARGLAPWLAPAIALLATAGLQLVVHADVEVHHLYGFHLNGFVWNLLITPGGLESLGADPATGLTVAAIGAGFLAIQVLLLLVARSAVVTRLLCPLGRQRVVIGVFAALFLLTAFEKLTYGMADVRNERAVLAASGAVPFYASTNIRNFAVRMGWMAPRDELEPLSLEDSQLEYPRAPLQRAADSRDWNLVWLVAESLRADALDPVVMPATSAFATRQCLDFQHHYSGGNGTRMGIFSMFYGLYGAYWFPFLAERRGPALIDLLCDAGYDVTARTSAKFTYPEFDATVWMRVPDDHLIECDPDLAGWQNDRRHVGDLLADLDARDPGQPFLQFLFLESAHARYTFPEESVIREPYLEHVNYATFDPERDAELLHNRYLNSCHHLDSQLARVFEGLEERGLLDSTIVIVTGDHGEEFMEKGHWGHHASFSEESTRVPLLLHVPGVSPERVTRLTSHLDIVPTLAALLGVTNASDEFSLGHDLLGGFEREHCVVADWERLAIVDGAGKGVFPVRGSAVLDTFATALDDGPLADQGAWFEAAAPRMAEVLEGLSRFVR